MSMPSRSPERGLIVASRYRLESVLGEGGMAVVWHAVHTETDRKVALKLVRADFVTDERVRELFVQEARVAARIGANEHIVDVLDAGVDEALGVPFIAMELLQGATLESTLTKGPLPRALAAELLDQLADALEQAHGAGVFHRDLKPGNLFLTTDRKGQPKLKVLDFGIAKLSETTVGSATHIGTPAYSAPEQLGESWRKIAAQRGKPIATRVSAATDVWALGLIAFDMLSAAPAGAFWGAYTLAELPVKIVLEPLPAAATRTDPARIPSGFDAWLARCLDLDARHRWPTARAAVDALKPLLTGSSPPPAWPSPRPVAATAPAPAPAPAPAHAHAHAHARALSGTGPPPAMAPDPILAWSAHRRAELRAPGDPRAFAWQVVYLPRLEQVTREARIALPHAELLIAEGYTVDPLRKAIGEDRMLVAMVRAPTLRYRAALRSQRSSGVVDGMARGLKALDALVSSNPGRLLRDPQFEQQYEVWSPTAAEAHVAIPIPLRHVLMGIRFHGILERFPGALLVTMFDAFRFEPASLERLLDTVNRILPSV